MPTSAKSQFSATSVVLIGLFRPDDFTPDKLVSGGIIDRKAGASASFISLIPGAQVHIKFGWGELLVQQNRFQVVVTEAPFVRACDFALKAVNDLGQKLYVSSFGINRDEHFNLGTFESVNEMGRRLAPPSAWGSWGEEILRSMDDSRKGSSLQGGTSIVQMKLPFRDDRIYGWLDVAICPSFMFKGSPVVHFRANYHHQVGESIDEFIESSDVPLVETINLLKLLSDRFDSAIDKVDSIFQEVLA